MPIFKLIGLLVLKNNSLKVYTIHDLYGVVQPFWSSDLDHYFSVTTENIAITIGVFA